MLATLGFWQQEWVTLPGMTPVADSNLAPSVVGVSAMLQIIVWMGVLEFWTNKGNVTMEVRAGRGAKDCWSEAIASYRPPT